MIIAAYLLLVVLLALTVGFVYFGNRLIDDSATQIPGPVRWLLRTCGDFWWAPPVAWLAIVVVLAFLADAGVGIGVAATACVVLAGFCWAARRELTGR